MGILRTGTIKLQKHTTINTILLLKIVFNKAKVDSSGFGATIVLTTQPTILVDQLMIKSVWDADDSNKIKFYTIRLMFLEGTKITANKNKST